MRRKLLILVYIGVLLSITAKGQNQVSGPTNSNERAAVGQTKWMLHNLKFDSLQFQAIYNINLKYQIRSDSVHKLQNIASAEKKRLYQVIAKNKKDELKVVFDPIIYDRYLNLLQSIKQKQP